MLRHFLAKLLSLFGERITFEAAHPRSPGWPALRDDHLAKHPACAVCGGRKGVVPHHVLPYWKFPEHELDPANLISLCEEGTINCHLHYGHAGSWKCWVVNVRELAAAWAAIFSGRRDGEPVVAPSKLPEAKT